MIAKFSAVDNNSSKPYWYDSSSSPHITPLAAHCLAQAEEMALIMAADTRAYLRYLSRLLGTSGWQVKKKQAEFAVIIAIASAKGATILLALLMMLKSLFFIFFILLLLVLRF